MIVSTSISCKPREDSIIPHSTGYLIYSALLKKVKNHNPSVSKFIHQDQTSHVSISPLKGEFKPKDRNRKQIFENTDYRFYFNLITADEAFVPIFKELVLNGENLQIGDAVLELREMEKEEIELEDLIIQRLPKRLKFHFTSPASINYRNSGNIEMFPHREAVFKSLENSWNKHVHEELVMDLNVEEIKKNLVEQPKANTYQTHNVVVSRKEHPEKNHKIPIKAFGFTGEIDYSFKEADEKLRYRLGILSRWANYAGIGSHTAHGCGSVDTEVVTSE